MIHQWKKEGFPIFREPPIFTRQTYLLLWRSPGDAEENGWKREEWYKVIRAMRLADGFDMFSTWGLKHEAAKLLVVLERQRHCMPSRLDHQEKTQESFDIMRKLRVQRLAIGMQ